jgi:hypothetical protein
MKEVEFTQLDCTTCMWWCELMLMMLAVAVAGDCRGGATNIPDDDSNPTIK